VEGKVLLKWADFESRNLLPEGYALAGHSNMDSFKDSYIENEYVFYWRIPKSFSTTVFEMFKTLKSEYNISWEHRNPYFTDITNRSLPLLTDIHDALHRRAATKPQFTVLREPRLRYDSAINTIVHRVYDNSFPGFTQIVEDFAHGADMIYYHMLPQTYYLHGHQNVYLFDVSTILNHTQFNELMVRPFIALERDVPLSQKNRQEGGNSFHGFVDFLQNYTALYDRALAEEAEFYDAFLDFKSACR
jgi:hypothetical protein